MVRFRPKTICFVIPNYVTFTTGGAELQVYYLTKEFLKRGWKVELVYGKEKGQGNLSASPYYDERITYLSYRKYKFRAFEFFSALMTIFKSKAGYFYQRTDFALTASCALYCKLMKKHMTYALAQDQDAENGKYSAAFKTYNYQSSIKQWIRKLDFNLIDKLVEYGKRSASLIVCQNSQQQRLLKSNLNLKSEIVSSIAINPQLQDVKKENIILWVGNMHPVKQPQLFIELANRFANNDNWRFVMIGRIDERLIDTANSGVEIIGECSYDETALWYAKAKVFVNTSVREGMPNTFLQSWYNKALILSLNVNPDGIFTDDRYGIAFGGDLHQLGDDLGRIMSRSEINQEILTRSYAYVNEKYDPDKVVESLLQKILKHA